MNVEITRELVAQVVIMLAVCIGGWMMFVEPASKELAEVRVRIDATGVNGPTLSEASVEQAAARIQEAKKGIATISERNALTGDTSTLYGKIMDLAVTHGVTVRQLQPSSDRRKRNETAFDITQLDMTVEGTYENMSAFLDEIDTIGGFLRPASLQLTPLDRGGEHLVNARFSCDALQFTLPETLAQLEAVDAQP